MRITYSSGLELPIKIVAFILIVPKLMPENPLLNDLPYPKKCNRRRIE